MKIVMELTGDVRAAILRVLEEFRPAEGDSVTAVQASIPPAGSRSAMIDSSPAAASQVRYGEDDEATGQQDRPFPV